MKIGRRVRGGGGGISYFVLIINLLDSMVIRAAWRNGNASDYDWVIRRLQVRPLRWSYFSASEDAICLAGMPDVDCVNHRVSDVFS